MLLTVVPLLFSKGTLYSTSHVRFSCLLDLFGVHKEVYNTAIAIHFCPSRRIYLAFCCSHDFDLILFLMSMSMPRATKRSRADLQKRSA